MDTVAIYTLGCKANQADSDELKAALASKGFKIVGSRETAGTHIINTCTVTGKASYQSRQAVRRIIKRNPGAKIFVTGCDAEINKKTLEAIDGVTAVFKTGNTGALLESLEEGMLTQNKSLSFVSSRSRPFIRIQDGCENFCSYCIVPMARGKIKSVPEDQIIKKISVLSASGYYEVVLTGIHIGQYGRDMNYDLEKLLNNILRKTEIKRIRLSSIEPDGLGEDLIRLVAESGGRIAPHLHIPLQSGCDSVLERMKRRYTTREYENSINLIRRYIPDCSIGADVITGFPGETEDESGKTVNFTQSLPLTYLHVFSYSDRDGTVASGMSDKISEDVKKLRTGILRNISTEKRKKYLESHIGKEVTVVFDRSRVNGFWKGVSENYITILVKEKPDGLKWSKVRLTAIDGECMNGIIGE